ncbi:MAG TPA: hypothetical protein VNM48_05745 [Chloroflexota bacterium]|nr:hypothetical protein [Chloroflexota bacterium]
MALPGSRSSGGFGGPATPGAGALGSQGTDPLSGFAKQYSPAQATQAYDNPWYILKDVFKGISGSSPGFQSLRDFGGDPLSLYNVMKGADRTIEDSGGEEFINFMADLYKNMGSVGGRTFSSGELLGNIFGKQAGGSKETSLGQILSAGDESTQIRTLFNLLRDVSNVSMNPLAASGYQAAVARAGDDYGNQMMKTGAGNTMSPAAYMAQNTPWLTQR